VSRAFLISTGCIAALGVTSVLLIAFVSAKPRPLPGKALSGEPRSIRVEAASSGVLPSRQDPTEPEPRAPAPAQLVPDEPAWTPAERRTDEPWETIQPVNRFPGLGRIGAGVRDAMWNLHERELAPCFDVTNDENLRRVEEEEAGEVVDRTPVFMLELETLDHAVRIVGANVEQRGGASDKLLGCALAALRGATLDVPEAMHGNRHRFRYRLGP
jgi:hypothetical protein